MSSLSYEISRALESHIPFIYNSSLRSYKGTFPLYLIDQASYYRVFHNVIEKSINDLGVLVAYNPEDPDHILGYVIGNSAEIVYVYVKQDYRGLGVATDLIKRALLCGMPDFIGGGPGGVCTVSYPEAVRYSILTRSGAGLLKHLKKYVFQDVDFQYDLPTEVKQPVGREQKNAVRKEEIEGKREGQGQVALAVGVVS